MKSDNNPLLRPDNKFYNGKIDVFDKTMKERLIEIVKEYSIHKYTSYEKIAEESLKLFHDMIQTEREEYKYQILSEHNSKTEKQKFKDKDLTAMGLQQRLRNFRTMDF